MTSLRFHTPVLALASTALALTGVTAVATSAAADPDTTFCGDQSFVPVDALVEDQEVTGLSTVKGVDPTGFTGSYVGKLDGALGRDTHGNPRDLLLFRLSSPEIDGTDTTAPAGIWAGMSGSPVYDENGDLIGAVSYSFSNSADNVAGVTPAEYMKDISPTMSPLAAPKTVRLSASDRSDVAAAVGDSVPSTMHQISPAKVVAGAPKTRANRAAGQSRVLRTKAKTKNGDFRSGSASLAAAADYPIVAGGNIATTFSYGDITTAAVGTVTAVCDDQVFAFGHPDEFTGASNETFHGASAVRIVPDGGWSYKLANIGTVKGVINQDRMAGIQGTLDQVPDVVSIDTITTTPNHPASDPLIGHTDVSVSYALPYVTYMQVAQDAQDALDQYSSGEADMTWTIDYLRADGTPESFTRGQRITSSDYFPDSVGWEVASDLESLIGNGIEKITVTHVSVTSDLTPDYRAFSIGGAQVRKGLTWKNIPFGGTIPTKAGTPLNLRLKLVPASGSSAEPTTVEVPWKTGRKATQAGKVRFFGNDYSDFFFDDFGFYEEFFGLSSFDEFVEFLQSQSRRDAVTGMLQHKTKKNGKVVKLKEFSAPGNVGGDFLIRLAIKP